MRINLELNTNWDQFDGQYRRVSSAFQVLLKIEERIAHWMTTFALNWNFRFTQILIVCSQFSIIKTPIPRMVRLLISRSFSSFIIFWFVDWMIRTFEAFVWINFWLKYWLVFELRPNYRLVWVQSPVMNRRLFWSIIS